MNQSTSLVIHGIVLSGLTSVCKMMSLSHSQTKESVVKEKGCGSFEKGNYLSRVLISIFSDAKAKTHQN